MAKLILYGIDPSPPTRACLLTLKALEIPYDYKIVNLLNKEHMDEEYMAKNPQHTVPMLEDDDKYIWDSHAIMAYLVRRYGKDNTLYPGDFFERALVDQRLHFESGVMFQGVLRETVRPLFFENNNQIPLWKIDRTAEAYDFLEQFLKDNNYVAGNTLTIADFSIISNVSSIVAWLEVDAAKCPKLTAWIKRMQDLPYYQEANGNGAEQFIGMVKASKPIIVP